MDVKDIRVGIQTDALTDKKAPKRASALSSVSLSEVVDSVEVDSHASCSAHSDVRLQLNAVIASVNVASDATTEIGKLVSSLGGIVEQAKDNGLPDHRRVKLQDEANQLVSAIKEQVKKATPEGIRPLAGDPIRLKVEERIGRALEIILPDNSKDNFGIATISFSKKDAIIETQVTVEKARARIDDLRKALDSSREQVSNASVQLDVALQNSESSQASVRDVDQALKLAHNTSVGIGANPDRALQSISKLSTNILDLLKS